MTVFEEVKNKVNIIDVAQLLGIQLNRSRMCHCPFHNEKSASFSISENKQIFKCFGCGVAGDSIKLVELMLKLSSLEAVKWINDQFHLGVEFKDKFEIGTFNKYEQIKDCDRRLNKKDNKAFQVLCDYLHQMTPLEYLQYGNIIEYYIDMLIDGNKEDLKWFRNTEERWWKNLESRLRGNDASTSNRLGRNNN